MRRVLAATTTGFRAGFAFGGVLMPRRTVCMAAIRWSTFAFSVSSWRSAFWRVAVRLVVGDMVVGDVVGNVAKQTKSSKFEHRMVGNAAGRGAPICLGARESTEMKTAAP